MLKQKAAVSGARRVGDINGREWMADNSLWRDR
jgi:hypothetical protein